MCAKGHLRAAAATATQSLGKSINPVFIRQECLEFTDMLRHTCGGLELWDIRKFTNVLEGYLTMLFTEPVLS